MKIKSSVNNTDVGKDDRQTTKLIVAFICYVQVYIDDLINI